MLVVRGVIEFSVGTCLSYYVCPGILIDSLQDLDEMIFFGLYYVIIRISLLFSITASSSFFSHTSCSSRNTFQSGASGSDLLCAYANAMSRLQMYGSRWALRGCRAFSFLRLTMSPAP
ncbi:hypothetical protein IF1G_08283 [Cordyceps javanica]|uniref:Uncharacterized protein n=1 Tax=Cordyceps javanica TaxID=43265 RepID=A0A545UU54_9HYPO|nr:hypothetical protein IF1G_08283 [Cordyceps javanica]